MLRDAPGRYVASLAGGETVRAFVPDPLPPVPPFPPPPPLPPAPVLKMQSVNVAVPTPEALKRTAIDA